MARYNPLKPNKAARPPRREPIPAGTVPDPAPVSHEPVLRENDAKDDLEIRFPTRPSVEVLALFRATHDLPAEQRWHWHRRMKCWYAKRTDANRAFAAKIPVGTVSTPSQISPSLVATKEEVRDAVESVPTTDNVIPVKFKDPGPRMDLPAIIHQLTALNSQPLQRPPLPAWRQRLQNKTK